MNVKTFATHRLQERSGQTSAVARLYLVHQYNLQRRHVNDWQIIIPRTQTYDGLGQDPSTFNDALPSIYNVLSIDNGLIYRSSQ